jgi:hypothetical protein
VHFGRLLTPLLGIALLIQCLVAVVPHDHGCTAPDEPSLVLAGSFDAPHHCLACSVHTPSAAPAEDLASAWLPSGSAQAPFAGSCAYVALGVVSSCPRGPPSVI